MIIINRLEDITDQIELFTGIKINNEVFRECKHCRKSITVNKFRKRNKTKSLICNECLKKLENEGLRKCIICEEIFPITKEYFYTSSEKYKDICRVCSRKTVSEWQKKNKEKANAKARRYQKTERGRKLVMIRVRKHEFKKKQLPNNLTLEQWEDIKKAFNNKCAYCGEEKPLEQEHAIPVSKGGDYTVNNIIPSCRSCNSSKRDKNLKIWYRQQSFYSLEREQAIVNFLGYKEDKQQLKLI